jgi:hypothetical protein
MAIKLAYILFDAHVRVPGSSHSESHFAASAGWDISYSPETALVEIRKQDGEPRCYSIHRMRDCQILRPEKAKKAEAAA